MGHIVDVKIDVLIVINILCRVRKKNMFCHDVLVIRSGELYFGVLYPRCYTTREINTKIILWWAHKQSGTPAHTLFSMYPSWLFHWYWGSDDTATTILITTKLRWISYGTTVCTSQIDGLVQGCRFSSALAMGILQSYTKPSKYWNQFCISTHGGLVALFADIDLDQHWLQ